jgi:hypothetical protein
MQRHECDPNYAVTAFGLFIHVVVVAGFIVVVVAGFIVLLDAD